MMILSPTSKISHHHKVINITVTLGLGFELKYPNDMAQSGEKMLKSVISNLKMSLTNFAPDIRH